MCNNPPSMPHPDLASAVRAGDELAYQSLYTKYVPYLTRYLTRKNRDLSPDSIEDIIHDVLLGIWIRRNTWNPTSIPAYLTAAVKKRVIDHLRLRERSEAYRMEVEAGPSQVVEPYDVTMAFVSVSSSTTPVVPHIDILIQNSILRLPYSLYKEVCILHFYEGRTPGAIAKIAQLSNREVRRIIDAVREHIAVDLYAHGCRNFLEDMNRERVSQSLLPVTDSPFAEILDLTYRMRRELEQRPGLTEKLKRIRYSYAAFEEYTEEELSMLRQMMTVGY